MASVVIQEPVLTSEQNWRADTKLVVKSIFFFFNQDELETWTFYFFFISSTVILYNEIF